MQDKDVKYKIVFSDVDGTLLNSSHKVLPGTLMAIRALREKKIPFVITSARSPSGIYPILEENGIKCPMIAYSGALAMDESRNILFSTEMPRTVSADVISYIEKNVLDCSWNIYSNDIWIVKDKTDPRIVREEEIVRASAVEGTVDTLKGDVGVHKILCICNPGEMLKIERSIKIQFPGLSIVKSSDILLEIMQKGVTKSSAVTKLCCLWNIPMERAIAFGDYYNDVEMLETVALPFLMGNAPDKLKERFSNITLDNDREGIYHGLKQSGLIGKTIF